MGFEDHQRGYDEGYRGTPTRPAQNAGEAMGRAAGRAQRDQEFVQSQQASADYAPIPARFGWFAVGLFGVFAFAHWFMGGSTAVALLLAASCAALALVSRLRWLLRGLVPLYVGLWGGAALGSLSLAIRQSPLTLGNIAFHLVLGSAIGLGVVMARRRRR